MVAFATVLVAALTLPTVGMAEGSLAKAPAAKVQIDITGKPGAVATNTVDIETGKYHDLTVTSDGVDEALFNAPQFFQNVWLNHIVVNDAEIKMFGTTLNAGVEVGQDQPNKVEIALVAIKSADYPFLLNGKMGGTLHVH